jgi:hypothetical protein
MAEQQGNPRRAVALAIVLLVIAVAAFAAAFYMLDGYALVQEYLGGEIVQADDGPVPAQATESQTSPDELNLPEGMPDEFALRLWQEQVDSRENIDKLFAGEIDRFEVTDTLQDGEEATLLVEAFFTDGTTAPGTIGMRRFGDIWYFAFVSGMRQSATGGSADSVSKSEGEPPAAPLPSPADVDVALLNTMIAEQAKSSAVTARYAAGAIDEIVVVGTEPGPNTATVSVDMGSDGETGPGDVIALLGESNGKDVWFIARFTDTSSE